MVEGAPEKQIEADKKIEARDIVNSLFLKLPAIGRELIKQNENIAEGRGKIFFENPDSPAEHEPNWHQWGVITHTKMFSRFYREEVPQYFASWSIQDKVITHLAEQIDGVSKNDLLQIAIPLHDIGKFVVRKFEERKDGEAILFRNHEVVSGQIIRSKDFSTMLRQAYGLTDAQIEYIARCAELHFELGLMREEAKKSPMGYTIAFAESELLKEHAKAMMSKYKGFELEIGLLFLTDSLAKNDIRIQGDTDQDINMQDEAIKEIIAKKGLNPKLINGVKQLPINKKIAEIYLRTWAEAS